MENERKTFSFPVRGKKREREQRGLDGEREKVQRSRHEFLLPLSEEREISSAE